MVVVVVVVSISVASAIRTSLLDFHDPCGFIIRFDVVVCVGRLGNRRRGRIAVHNALAIIPVSSIPQALVHHTTLSHYAQILDIEQSRGIWRKERWEVWARTP